MISYKPFWDTLKRRKISGYTLIKHYKISSGTLNRMRNNAPLSTQTLNTLCEMLDCRVEDIIRFYPDTDLEPYD